MSVPVFSFVAFSGTGKTTFLEKLIPELKADVYKRQILYMSHVSLLCHSLMIEIPDFPARLNNIPRGGICQPLKIQKNFTHVGEFYI